MPLEPNRVAYSPIIERPPIKWPNGARVALWIAPNVEHYEYEPEFDGQRDPWPRMPYPDVQQYSYRDYGNRVGQWYLFDLLDEFDLPASHNFNSLLFEHCPQIADRIIARGDEFVGHGRTNAERQDVLGEPYRMFDFLPVGGAVAAACKEMSTRILRIGARLLQVDEADVRIDKSAASQTVNAGESTTFTLRVTNDGPSVADDLVVSEGTFTINPKVPRSAISCG